VTIDDMNQDQLDLKLVIDSLSIRSIVPAYIPCGAHGMIHL